MELSSSTACPGVMGIFLDTETNGLSCQKHRILEIALRVIDLYTGEERASFQTVVRQPDQVWDASSPEALEVNGFTKEKMMEGIPEASAAERIVKLFKELGVSRDNAKFICQNPRFDSPFFAQLIDEDNPERKSWPYHWLDLASMVWTYRLKEATPETVQEVFTQSLSKDKVAESLGLPPEERPHRAMNGVDHLLLIYQTVMGFPGAKAKCPVEA